MKLFQLMPLILITACSSVKWDHKKSTSPYTWGSLSQRYRSCDEGHHQTPINLDQRRAKEAEEVIEFNYHSSAANLHNNGYTLELEFKDQNFVQLEGTKYILKQLHFHSKSEHALNGVFYPGEMHLVHQAEDGKLLVVGLFIEFGTATSPGLEFFSQIPLKAGELKIEQVAIADLIQGAGSHFYYEGSLSTPPCSENVHWVIFDKHLMLNEDDMEKFEYFFHHNDRPLQKIKDHQLFYTRR
jgi:carbonic anhydrase